MDDPLFVRRFERLGDLARDRDGFVEANRSTRNAICERRPLDELEHQHRDVARLLDAKNSRDVRMIERGDELRFPFEAR